jgi:hypothetical protein
MVPCNLENFRTAIPTGDEGVLTPGHSLRPTATELALMPESCPSPTASPRIGANAGPSTASAAGLTRDFAVIIINSIKRSSLRSTVFEMASFFASYAAHWMRIQYFGRGYERPQLTSRAAGTIASNAYRLTDRFGSESKAITSASSPRRVCSAARTPIRDLSQAIADVIHSNTGEGNEPN